jgi:APA family basic amino acid/polyamine antiporter
MANLWVRKSLDKLTAEAGEGEKSLKRTLGAVNLVGLGIGAIIGAGLFVRTAAAIAERSGPSVTLAFLVAGLGCAFAGLCYAEFAAMIPIAGSAYTYSYATMGEFAAWIIGWDLVLEYAVGAATVAIAWSEYLNRMLAYFDMRIPYEWCHSPFDAKFTDAAGVVHAGIINLPAVFILLALTAVLIRGTKESALLNGLIVITKVSIVVMVIVFGWGFIDAANHSPYLPAATKYTTVQGVVHDYGGIMGILGAAGVVFFAFIGFDAVSTAAQEAKNPERNMPIGLLGSLAICTTLYIAVVLVLTGIIHFSQLNVPDPLAVAIDVTPARTWLSPIVKLGALLGTTAVILVMLLGQTRVFYSMAHDGLLPSAFGQIHPRFRTPYKSTLLTGSCVALAAGILPLRVVGELVSIGTLLAFVIVCGSVLVLRKTRPDIPRPFRTPFVWVVAPMGMAVCLAQMLGLPGDTWLRLLIWMLLGVFIYFLYGQRHSLIQKASREAGAATRRT